MGLFRGMSRDKRKITQLYNSGIYGNINNGVKSTLSSHNPKVVGSNPAPATMIKTRGYVKNVAPFLLPW